ncbi:MAG: hypothetical protein ACI8WB_002098 [Phenylobacterium sp.]
MVDLWERQGYVEIYQTKDDRKHGLIKDSSTNTKGILCPFYIGLFHARLAAGETDPLVIVKFHEEGEEQYIDLKFMLDHDDIFGNRAQKNDPQQLRIIWKNIDDFVTQSEGKL